MVWPSNQTTFSFSKISGRFSNFLEDLSREREQASFPKWKKGAPMAVVNSTSGLKLGSILITGLSELDDIVVNKRNFNSQVIAGRLELKVDPGFYTIQVTRPSKKIFLLPIIH